MKFKQIATLVFCALLGLNACKKDDFTQTSSTPETSIFLKEINRSGTNRLNTTVRLNWNGEVANGFIAAYEISFDSVNWTRTTVQDSVFKFIVNSGSDTTDINFYVRAIDNKGVKDLSPAYLKIPIKNTQPTVSFDRTVNTSDTVYSVFSLLFNAKDADGKETIDSIFIQINNGKKYALSKNINFLTIVPTNPNTIGNTDAQIFTGFEALAVSKKINGLIIGGKNTITVQCRDLAGSISKTDTLSSFYIRPKNSDLLIIDAYNLQVSPKPEEIYLPSIQTVYGNADVLDIFVSNAKYKPKFFEPTFTKLISLYDKVICYADGNKIGDELALEIMASSFTTFLNAGKKLMAISSFPTNLARTSKIFTYLPIDSFPVIAQGQRIDLPTDSLATSTLGGYPTLKASKQITAIDVFNPTATATIMYRANTKNTGITTAPKCIMAKSNFTNGRTNVIFVSTDLFSLDADANANTQKDELNMLFNKVLKDEFNW